MKRQGVGLRRGPGLLPFFGKPSELLHDLAGAYCKREEFIVPGKGLFQRCAVIDDYVVITEMGFGKMATIRPAVNQYLITVTIKLNV
jgi:hypothetical protein